MPLPEATSGFLRIGDCLISARRGFQKSVPSCFRRHAANIAFASLDRAHLQPLIDAKTLPDREIRSSPAVWLEGSGIFPGPVDAVAVRRTPETWCVDRSQAIRKQHFRRS